MTGAVDDCSWWRAWATRAGQIRDDAATLPRGDARTRPQLVVIFLGDERPIRRDYYYYGYGEEPTVAPGRPDAALRRR